ncbi:MAG TPA: LPXTG cell wall anchor domain-containing protein [Actinomycetota bacterium]
MSLISLIRRPAVLAAALLSALTIAGPAAGQALASTPRDLRVSSATCGGVSVVVQGMPASQQLFLLVRNVADGKTLDGPAPVHSDSDGSVQSSLRVDLSAVRTVDVSIWTKQGATLTMAAKDTAVTSCGHLPMTGDSSSRDALLAVALVAIGALVVWSTRSRRTRATR